MDVSPKPTPSRRKIYVNDIRRNQGCLSVVQNCSLCLSNGDRHPVGMIVSLIIILTNDTWLKDGAEDTVEGELTTIRQSDVAGVTRNARKWICW